MLLNPHKLEDNHLYVLATVPGDNNMYEGVKFSDGVARLVPGYFAKKMIGKVCPLCVFQVDDEIEWINRQPEVRKAVAVKLDVPDRIEVLENAVDPPKRKRGRPRKN